MARYKTSIHLILFEMKQKLYKTYSVFFGDALKRKWEIIDAKKKIYWNSCGNLHPIDQENFFRNKRKRDRQTFLTFHSYNFKKLELN